MLFKSLARNESTLASEATLQKDILESLVERGPRPDLLKSLCVISGRTKAIYTRPDGAIVVPITALKP